MPRITNEIRIDRRPESVWAVLGDLTAVRRWVPGVSSVRMEGMRRICALEDGSEIHEEITGFSADERRYAYDQVVHPLGLKRSHGTLAVEANGQGSRVIWDAEVDFVDGVQESQALPMLRQGYAAALEQLKEVSER